MSSDQRGIAGGERYLPVELIPNIARRLTSLQDFFALRAACRAYRDALPPSRANLAAQPPHLLAPHVLVPGSSPSLALFHLPLRRALRFRARLPCSHALYSDGARVISADRFARELVITHVLSGEQVRIPDCPTLCTPAILTDDLVLLHGPEDVWYCRLGDRIWREASCGGLHDMLHDMRSVNGVLYALLHTCRLAVAELLDNGSVQLTLLGGEADEHVLNACMGCNGFMLGECAGGLLLIFKVSIAPTYKIFRWDSQEQKWARMLSLGGRTLFMSRCRCEAWLGPDSPGVRGDCVYETLSLTGGWSEFSLADGSCERFTIDYQGAPPVGHLRPQVWVLPSLL